MLVTLKELLVKAEENKTAIGAFNVPNMECLRGVVQAAEILNVPIILQHAEVHENLVSIEEIGPLMIEYAQGATVPIAVHLDHGSSLEYCMKAIRLGFTSIMYDASLKEYKTNLKETKEIVNIAHSVNVSVEAELGEMSNSKIGGGEGRISEDHNIGNVDLFTNPLQARDFVTASNVDCLAISFGTVHGKYVSEPNLDFNRILEIRNITSKLPLVMHGGSGISKEDYRKAIECGIRKINYYTYMNIAAARAVADFINDDNQEIFFDDISLVATEAVKKNTIKVLEIFNGL